MGDLIDRFEIIDDDMGWTRRYRIFRDRETGVHYLFMADGTVGGLTALLQADGTPVTS